MTCPDILSIHLSPPLCEGLPVCVQLLAFIIQHMVITCCEKHLR